MTKRHRWEDLGADVREAVQELTGAVVGAGAVAEGINSDVTLRLDTKTGRFFVKGVIREGEARRLRSLDREAAIAATVAPVGATLRGRVRVAGWDLLVFDFIDGRRIDYSPGSPDIPLILETLAELAELECPDLRLPFLEQRLSNFADPASLHRFIGDGLLHTDLNPGNVRVAADGQARLVDWATPTRGASWANAADLCLCLITCGHTPRDAEEIVSALPAWKEADGAVLDAFVSAVEATWRGAPRDGSRWTNATIQGVRRWSKFRAEVGSWHA